MPFYILSLDGSSDRTYIRSPKISNSKSMGIIERALIRSRKRQFVNNRYRNPTRLTGATTNN
ncbi:hypothetical protein OUZ56_003744 [Daphnia magna]|uniref:Uncharacterized protein n=1 Tax=Daphnia magna TaxID=35525 RepID=A0ABR0AA04_9CRUS|nr:hypothetical protein OUZ56_003744 [Daphnia magna]